MPSPDNLRRISLIAGGGDHSMRKIWYTALIAARRKEKSIQKQSVTKSSGVPAESASASPKRYPNRPTKRVLASAIIVVVGSLLLWSLWTFFLQPAQPSVNNIRICNEAFFDSNIKKCVKHVSVFVHGEDEVFLSFDFDNVPRGTPFERWWIRNGERVAGRTSFNDVAWPGYTFWRPGVLPEGEYVVRIVVESSVFTQVFNVQPNGFRAD